MKLKEVCELTGLSKKTIRFYEEKHLIFPEVRYQNGRNFREYSQKNIDDLLEIATLRKALFSIEDIYTMQQAPEEIADILKVHAQRTKELYDHLKFLNHTIGQIKAEEISDVSTLARELHDATKQLPLPSYDIKPNFRYLDEIELKELELKNRMRTQRQGEDTVFLEHQNLTVRKGLFSEYFPYNASRTGGSANFPQPEEEKVLRIVNLVLSSFIMILALIIIWFSLQRRVSTVQIWQELRAWMIPFEVLLVIIRLTTKTVYQIITGKGADSMSQERYDGKTKRDDYIKYSLIALAAVIVFIGAILLTRQAKALRSTNPDFTIVIGSEEAFNDSMVEEFTGMMEAMIGDRNGDGKTHVKVEILRLLDYAWAKEQDRMAAENGQEQEFAGVTMDDDFSLMMNYIGTGECYLYLLSEQPNGTYKGAAASYSKEEFFAELPKELQSEAYPNGCDLSSAPFWEDLGIEDVPFYGFVLDGNSENERECAMAVLRTLQNTGLAMWY